MGWREGEIELAGRSGWWPSVFRDEQGLRGEIVGGADEMHDPRTFSLPITEAHLEALRASASRHLLLAAALGPLCSDAGTSGPLDQEAGRALLDSILLAPADDIDALLRDIRWDRAVLVAFGADPDDLDAGRVLASVRDAKPEPDWQRAREDDAAQQRARRGVTLSELDTAVLRYTGQLLRSSGIPGRHPSQVAPALLPQVLEIIGAAERATAGMRIALDARAGARATSKRDWEAMQHAARAAVRAASPQLVDDAVRAVSYLLCSEAADRARRGPYDVDAVDGRERGHAPGAGERSWCFGDELGDEERWTPDSDASVVEAFWAFVAARSNSKNEVFTIEDEASAGVLQLVFHANAAARAWPLASPTAAGPAEHRVEYGMVDGLATYRALVRAYTAGGVGALDGMLAWTADREAFEARRKGAMRPGDSPTVEG